MQWSYRELDVSLVSNGANAGAVLDDCLSSLWESVEWFFSHFE
jgi:hypothetical protein